MCELFELQVFILILFPTFRSIFQPPSVGRTRSGQNQVCGRPQGLNTNLVHLLSSLEFGKALSSLYSHKFQGNWCLTSGMTMPPALLTCYPLGNSPLLPQLGWSIVTCAWTSERSLMSLQGRIQPPTEVIGWFAM